MLVDAEGPIVSPKAPKISISIEKKPQRYHKDDLYLYTSNYHTTKTSLTQALLFMTVHRLLSKLTTIGQTQYHDPLTNTTLDLAYILPNLVVCSGPVDDQLHKHHRPNRLPDLVKFLDFTHGVKKWKFYNLRSEKIGYTPGEFLVSYYPVLDHEAPPFQLILDIVEDMRQWLADPEHVAVLHCKQGKGRSGTIACCYLLYLDSRMTPNQANEYFSRARFVESYRGFGVSILSQRRYINYYYHYLCSDKMREKLRYFAEHRFHTRITEVIIHHAVDPNITVDIKTYNQGHIQHCTQLSSSISDKDELRFTSDHAIEGKSDLRLSFNHPLIIHDSLSMLQIPSSYNYIWFNALLDFFGTRYLTRNTTVSTRTKISDTEEDKGEMGNCEERYMCTLKNTKSCSWDELDGFKGYYHRGLKLFDSVDISYEITYTDTSPSPYINSCSAAPVGHGSHVRRMLQYHRKHT